MTSSASRSHFAPLPSSSTPRRAGAAMAVALHLIAAGALLSYEPARSALLAAMPIMIQMITPPKPEPVAVPKPEAPKPVLPAELPKPKPVARTVQKPKPVPVEPAPLIATPSESLPATETPAAAASAPAPAPAGPPGDTSGGAAGASAGVTAPIFNAGYLENPAPAYPSLSRRMREEGRVMLRVLVNAKGAADEVQIRTSSGTARLDEAALETVKRWKFVPAKRGSEAISAWVLIPISFKLDG